MYIKEAYDKGLLKKGRRVRCNGDGGKINAFFTGEITYVNTSSLFIRRDDGKGGGGNNSTWIVHYMDEIEIFVEQINYKIKVEQRITKHTVRAICKDKTVYVNFKEARTLSIGDEFTILGYKEKNIIYV